MATIAAPSVVGCCADNGTTSNSLTGLPVAWLSEFDVTASATLTKPVRLKSSKWERRYHLGR